MKKVKVYLSGKPSQTKEIAEKFARKLKNNEVIGLIGGLGSGKTCWVSGMARGMRIRDKVHSPTFLIVHEYKNKNEKRNLYHIDLYRLNKSKELEDIGFAEYIYGDGVKVIEWADKFKEILPKATVYVKFDIMGESKRKISIYYKKAKTVPILAKKHSIKSGQMERI